MKSEQARAVLATLLALLLTPMSLLDVVAANVALGKVVPRGPADLNGTRLALETTVYSGDTLTTPADGLALILLSKGDQLHVGPTSEVQVTYTEAGILATLALGALMARSGSGQSISVRARGLLVSPQTAAWYTVALTENAVVVSADQGTVTVQGTNQSYTVPAGKATRFEVADASQAPAGAGAGAGIGSGAAAAIGIAISVGVAVPIGWLIADKLADDARRQACIEAIKAVSPTAPTDRCK